MRNADHFDLAELDLSSVDVPANGSAACAILWPLSLPLRLRSGGSRTCVIFKTKEGKTVRETLGDAALLPLASAQLLACGPVATTSAGGGCADP